jgi:hypothetical protein
MMRALVALPPPPRITLTPLDASNWAPLETPAAAATCVAAAGEATAGGGRGGEGGGRGGEGGDGGGWGGDGGDAGAGSMRATANGSPPFVAPRCQRAQPPTAKAATQIPVAPREKAGPMFVRGDRGATIVPRGSFTSSRKLGSLIPVRPRGLAAANHPVGAVAIVAASRAPVERNFRGPPHLSRRFPGTEKSAFGVGSRL